jgi:hypothetical protein
VELARGCDLWQDLVLAVFSFKVLLLESYKIWSEEAIIHVLEDISRSGGP